MILLLLMVPYEIEAGNLEIIDRSKNIFNDGIKVFSENIYMEAKSGIETPEYLMLEDSVFVRTEDISMRAFRIKYFSDSRTLYAGRNIRLWRKDTLKGDSLVYFRNSESGNMYGKVRYISDSITVNGTSGYYSRDSIKIRGRPRFNSPSITVDSDSILYFSEDSIFVFLSDVKFQSGKIFGKGEELKHWSQENRSLISQSPYIFQRKDTISGDIINISHDSRMLNAIKGTTINYTEEGRNKVWGDTVRIYYGEKEIDSVYVLDNAEGQFRKK